MRGKEFQTLTINWRAKRLLTNPTRRLSNLLFAIPVKNTHRQQTSANPRRGESESAVHEVEGKGRRAYIRHSTLLSWLQNGQLNTVASFSWPRRGAGLAALLRFPIFSHPLATTAQTRKNEATQERMKMNTCASEICTQRSRNNSATAKTIDEKQGRMLGLRPLSSLCTYSHAPVEAKVKVIGRERKRY